MTNVTSFPETDISGLSATIQDYLALIYVMERDQEPVVGTRLAELLRVTPPTVTNTLKRMVRDGLLTMDKNGTHLTEAGWRAARTVMTRHMLMEWMMLKTLPWSKLHSEAHHLEHAISALTESSLLEQLGRPQTCPHGNPLPGAGGDSWLAGCP
jgi:DtxR family Mn-dependent transcriptional regulator